VRITSSPYGPYGLGYTRATMNLTKRYTIKSIWSKTQKVFVFRL